VGAEPSEEPGILHSRRLLRSEGQTAPEKEEEAIVDAGIERGKYLKRAGKTDGAGS